jgi:S1-C subfamily serine protease
MYVLTESKPGETVKAVVLREGKRVELQATFQESGRPK